MAKPVKQLRDHLQEKQEPFMLELYLVEKGYLRKSRNSLESCDLKRSQKDILQCSKVLRAVCNGVVSLNDRLRIKNSDPRDGKDDETPELDRFSSASSSTVFDSCTVSDGEETSTSQQKEHITIRVAEVVTDRKLRCQCIEESRQLSPVSVLEEVASNRDGLKNLSSIKQKNGTNNCALPPKKVTEDSILSASLWKILFQSTREKSTLPAVPEIQELVHCNLSWRNLKSKKVLQQTRQLLFDCVREMVETQERKKEKRQQQKREYLATTEEFGKLFEEKIKCWGKQYGEESNLAHLLELDFQNATQEWVCYKPQGKKIGCEIGDAILEMILNEIVMDMVDF